KKKKRFWTTLVLRYLQIIIQISLEKGLAKQHCHNFLEYFHILLNKEIGTIYLAAKSGIDYFYQARPPANTTCGTNRTIFKIL
ncbi:hypothetical protein BpHYR1_017974, partial [Brachionus plicatilis]